MANKLGVVIQEKDLSKSTSALTVPAGAIAGYAIKGPTDKAYLCRSEDDLRRLFGQPQALMGDDGSLADYNLGLHYAFKFCRTGLPMYFKRAIPTTLTGGGGSTPDGSGKAFVLFQKELAASVDADSIKAVAKGHGEYYNGLSSFIKGIESVQATVSLKAGIKVSLGDNVLPGSLVITDAGVTPSSDNDKDITYAERAAKIKVLTTTLTGAVSVNYEDSVKTGNFAISNKSGDFTAIGETVNFVGSGATGKYISDNAPTGGSGSMVIGEITGTPLPGDVITGVTSTKTAVLDAVTSLKDKETTLSATNGVSATVQYERTTSDRVVRLFVCDDGETDPVSNNYENYLVSFKAGGKDEAGNGIFIEDVINGQSEIIDIKVGSTYNEDTLPCHYLATAGDITGVTGLASGDNGTYAASDSDIVTAYREMDPRQKNGRYYDIVYLFDAGYEDNVKVYLGDLAAVKIFPHVYMDPKKSIFIENGNKLKSGLVASTVVNALVAWRMGLGNKEFASISGSCWGMIIDEFNAGRNLWVGPTYEVGAASIIVDNTLGPWNSVMGPRRGVTNFVKLAINLYDYRDELNAKQMNSLVVDERGIQMYYGNKTAKTVASQMQQSHARKTRSRLSRELYFTALDYVAENLVNSTYNGCRDEFEAIIEQNYGPALESYSLVVGPPATTTDDLNNQIFRIKAGFIFNQIAEEIIIETTVFRNGTDLSVQVA